MDMQVPAPATPAYVIPGSHPPRSRKPLFISLGIIVVLIALGVGAYFYTPLGEMIKERVAILKLPAELKDAGFLAETPTGTILYRVENNSFVPHPMGGTAVSVERTGNSIESVIHNGSNFSVQVNGKEVYASTTPLIGVAVSPNGNDLAISAQLSKTDELPQPVYLAAGRLMPASWVSILMLAKDEQKSFRLGQGLATWFVDATHIARLSPAGIVSFDTQTGGTTVLVPQLTPYVIPATLRSPDHTLLAMQADSPRTFTVYRVTASAAQKVATVSVSGAATSFALGNDAFYTVCTTGTGTQVLKQPLAGGAAQIIATLPQQLHITRLLLGSL